MTIKKQGDEWCAFSEDGSRSFGCFPTKGEAEARLREVEFFKNQNSESVRVRIVSALDPPDSPENEDS